MSGRRWIGVVVAMLALTSVAARADESNDAIWKRANEAYLKGDFKAAIDAYELVLAAGVDHEDLHYNLGNAYVQADRLGPAIYHYEMALAHDPTQEDAKANLTLARQMAAERMQDKLLGEERDPYWIRALAGFTPGGLTLLFLGVYVLAFALGTAVWLLPGGFLRVSLLVVLVFAGLGAVGTGALLGGRWYLQTRVQQAIVLPDELAVKEGPDANYQTSFLVHAGLKVRIAERDGDWVRVRLSNGLEGWVRDRDLGRM